MVTTGGLSGNDVGSDGVGLENTHTLLVFLNPNGTISLWVQVK